MVQDSEMAGAEVAAAEESDDGSEDLEAESSGSEDEELEEEVDEAEGDADEAMELDGAEKPIAGANGHMEHSLDAVMAH